MASGVNQLIRSCVRIGIFKTFPCFSRRFIISLEFFPKLMENENGIKIEQHSSENVGMA